MFGLYNIGAECFAKGIDNLNPQNIKQATGFIQSADKLTGKLVKLLKKV